MKIKKILTTVLCTAMAASVLAGCSAGANTSSANGQAESGGAMPTQSLWSGIPTSRLRIMT